METATVTRSISLPVQECASLPWKDFLRVLHGAWRQSTDLANWASHTCSRQDVTRTPAMKELPPYQTVDLYALAFGRARERAGRTEGKVLPAVAAQFGGDGWTGAKIAAASLLRKVQAKYVRERGKVIWRRERRTPEFLYPYPFPVPPQAWAVYFDGGRPFVSLGLPGGRVALRLRNGPEFAHAVAVLKKIEAGDCKQLELSLCRQRSVCPDRLDAQRLPGGGHRETYRVMVRFAYEMEVYGSASDVVCEARTGGDPFLNLVCPGRRQWLLQAPWVRQWVAAHKAFLDRFAHDLKFEKRWPRGKRRRLNRRRERGCDKNANRMKSFRQETAAQAVGWAARMGCGKLIWDDTDRSFCESFPWHLLRQTVQNKCDEMGLVFQAASGAAVETEGGAEPVPTTEGEGG